MVKFYRIFTVKGGLKIMRMQKNRRILAFLLTAVMLLNNESLLLASEQSVAVSDYAAEAEIPEVSYAEDASYDEAVPEIPEDAYDVPYEEVQEETEQGEITVDFSLPEDAAEESFLPDDAYDLADEVFESADQEDMAAEELLIEEADSLTEDEPDILPEDEEYLTGESASDEDVPAAAEAEEELSEEQPEEELSEEILSDAVFTSEVTDPESGERVLVTMSVPASSLPCPADELYLEANILVRDRAKDLVEDQIQDEEDVRRETVLFDIALMKDGFEIEPAGPVSVSFAGLEIPNDDAQVFHVDEETDFVEEIPSGMTLEGDLVMDTDHFSIYAVTYTVESWFRSYTGENFKITVNYTADAGIPEGAELFVSELIQGTAEYDSYLSASGDELGLMSESDITFARFFDIQLQKDGVKVEPYAPVEVKIEYADAPQRTEGDSLSVIHFGEQGTEIIHDISANDALTEIVYEQGSFSVTGTIISNPSGTEAGTAYILVAKHDGKYYNVLSDGTLAECTYDEATNKVNTADPMVWLYQSSWGKNYLCYKAEGYDYGDDMLAKTFGYTYIDPTSESGLATDEPNGKVNNKTQFISPRDHSAITLDGQKHIYCNNDGNYRMIAVSADGSRLIGNLNPFVDEELAEINSTEFYLASPDFYDGGSDWVKKHLVDHIDISVSGKAEFDVPLAYGDYYDENGNIILTVTEPRSIHLQKEVAVSQKNIRTAEINAELEDGTPIDDAFYISGYTSNAQSDYSLPQVRIEGMFKVANLPDVPWYTGGNDPSIKAQRLQNIIWYNIVATEPDVVFEYEDPVLGKLYDRNGNVITITGDVTIPSRIHYWKRPDANGKGGNECPPLQEGFVIYQYVWDGAIHTFNNSGMDFELVGDVDVKIEPVAVEIQKHVVDEEGNELDPNKTLDGISFDVYENAGASPAEVAGLDVGAYDTPANYSGYRYHSSNPLDYESDSENNNTVYNYTLPQGMIYIQEDKDTIPDKITDKNGDVWIYKETRIETEYVWRGSGDEGKRHVSETSTKESGDYKSIPEVLGQYEGTDGSNLNNEFLEFYVYNVYEKPQAHKKEIAPFEGTESLGGVKPVGEITYEISYENYEKAPAVVYITDTLDPNVTYVSSSDNGTENGGVVTWTLPDVPAGTKSTVTLTVKVKK